MTLTGRSILGFASAPERDGARFHGVNAATGERLEPAFAPATLSDVDAAVRLASDAFPIYGKLGGKEKGALLRRIAENLEASRADLVERAKLEAALPNARLHSEIGRTIGQLVMFAELVEAGTWVDARIDRADPERKPLPKPDVRSMLRALGPVVVFGASNFPIAFSVAGGDTASALAAGCPVIVKAHPSHPGTSEIAGIAIQNAVRDCGLPEGTFSLLFDAGIEIGVALTKHPDIRAVAFTGSRRGGLALLHAASTRPRPIPVYAEMGSVNPLFVLPNAMRERGAAIAAGLAGSVTMGVGQFCTNPGLVIVEAGAESDAFVRELAEKLGATAPAAMLNAGICATYRAGVVSLESTPGVETKLPSIPVPDVDRYAAPALLVTDDETFLSNHHLMDEVFGPSTLVVSCKDASRMSEIASRLEGQLTATIHGTEADLASQASLAAQLEEIAGRIVFNGFPTGVEVCHAMVHGGPFPATTDGRSTSVGTRAIERFTRAIAYQDAPAAILPPELR